MSRIRKTVFAVMGVLVGGCLDKTVPDPDFLACQNDLYGEDCPAERRAQICDYLQANPESTKYGFTRASCDRYVGEPGDGGTDAGTADEDGGEDARVAECDDSRDCSGSRPVCESGSCIACDSSAQCADRTDSPVCDESGACVPCSSSEPGACAGDEVCRQGGNECVQCNVSAECPANAAARCEGNSCVGCIEDADCGHLSNKVCDAGQCVQCTGRKAQQCNGAVCDSRKRICATGVLPGSADFCDACLSDAHCGKSGDALCLPTGFGGRELGFFCQPKLTSGETCIDDHRPYIAAAVDAQQSALASIDGAVDASCRLALTTCAALGDFRSETCSGPSDDDACGVAGLSDGVCVAVPAQNANRCSIPCLSNGDCKVGSTCGGAGACSL